MRSVTIVLFLFIQIGLVWAQENSSSESATIQVYNGYVNNQPGLWREGISTLEQLSENSEDKELLLELASARYGLLGYCIASKACDDTEEQIDKMEDDLRAMLKKDPKWAEANAMMGALYGLKIGMNPAMGIFWGRRSSQYIEDATQFDALSPIAWMEKGNAKYFAPKLFGGNIDEAINCYNKAADLFVKQQKEKSWQYLHTLACLGMAYEKKENMDNAKQVYQRALKAEPSFDWVRNELLPKVQESR